MLAVDGSITEVPNTDRKREYFGSYNNQSERKLARSMVSVIYDVENDLILESKICNWKAAERVIAKELIECLETKGFQNDLIIFDRGYPSRDFISFLERKGLKYLIRIKRNRSSTQFDNANKNDQTIKVKHKDESLHVRVINVALQSGEIEKLITNIHDDSFTNEDFKKIYFKRWGVEVKYNQLKSRYELENFSGSTPIAIMQDFYSAIYLSNMMTLAKNEANERVELQKTGLKYEYKVNMNILIPHIRQILIKCLLTDDVNIRKNTFDDAMSVITKNLIPVRPNRSFSRKEPSRKNKFPLNRKRSM
ncbi:MAG: transposase [Syntrophomonadaceae bacterium]|nr:transposase [Syntrophomonadaceae bacterium]